MERMFRNIPTAPRCKLCQAPFEGPFAPLFRIAGFKRWNLNQQLCRWCIGSLEKQPGGAEIPVSLLYADLRDSTTIAEQLGPSEFTTLLNRFYSIVARAVDAERGIVDHMAGDGVFALWIPAFAGADHPAHAAAAGRRVVDKLAEESAGGIEIPAGVAAHAGEAYVGVVGEEGSRDFTALGDPVNTVARLAASAAPGQLIVTDAVVEAGGIDTTGMDHRQFELKGKSEMVGGWVSLN